MPSSRLTTGRMSSAERRSSFFDGDDGVGGVRNLAIFLLAAGPHVSCEASSNVPFQTDGREESDGLDGIWADEPAAGAGTLFFRLGDTIRSASAFIRSKTRTRSSG